MFSLRSSPSQNKILLDAQNHVDLLAKYFKAKEDKEAKKQKKIVKKKAFNKKKLFYKTKRYLIKLIKPKKFRTITKKFIIRRRYDIERRKPSYLYTIKPKRYQVRGKFLVKKVPKKVKKTLQAPRAVSFYRPSVMIFKAYKYFFVKKTKDKRMFKNIFVLFRSVFYLKNAINFKFLFKKRSRKRTKRSRKRTFYKKLICTKKHFKVKVFSKKLWFE